MRKYFKVGDLVRCIKPKPGNLIEGETYEVSEVYNNKHGSYLCVKGNAGGWYRWRFEKAEVNGWDERIKRISKPQPKLKRMLRPVE